MTVGEGKQDKVLVSRYDGKLYATGAYCSHFGVDLKWGMLFGRRVICPAHGASFDVVDGSLLSNPGLDGIPTYQIVEDHSGTYVSVPEDGLKAQSVERKLTPRDPNDPRNYVIIGGGAAGMNCAENLRYSGYAGKITMISPENMLPYDRTMLSKALPVGDADKWKMRCPGFHKRASIDIIKDKVYSIHPDVKKLALERGEAIAYDKVLIATGGDPRRPPIPGMGSKNVCVLRSNQD